MTVPHFRFALLWGALLAASGPRSIALSSTMPALPTVSRAPFGIAPDGKAVEAFTLTNATGMEVRAMPYGATILSIRVPDAQGAVGDVVLGFDSLAGYVKSSPYFGAVVGRYGNRIARGRFMLDGKEYTLAVNNGPHALHGGLRGFDKAVWAAEPTRSDRGVGLAFTLVSPDGDEGYPGTVAARVTYTLMSARNVIVIDYEASTDRATPLNLTNHSYFNLAGKGDILGHLLTMDADHMTPVDATLIPTGEISPVQGTPFDFRRPTAIGARIDARDQQIANGGGYDHNFVINRSAPGLVHVARVTEEASGRTLDVSSTEPGVQFYSGNFLDGTVTGKGGTSYKRRSGFCLETQHYPDSPNHPNFPSAILRPGSAYRSQTVFAFGVTR